MNVYHSRALRERFEREFVSVSASARCKEDLSDLLASCAHSSSLSVLVRHKAPQMLAFLPPSSLFDLLARGC